MNEVRDQLRALQGPTSWGSLGLDELCLTPGVNIPKKFKVPDWEKFDGTSNPLFHLRTYCTKMSVWSRDERFLIHFFQESLKGSASVWFMQLDHSKIKRWRDLADAFMSQYKFNLNMAPTREELRGMTKKSTETFKEYAQRWRVVASQVQPPLINSEVGSYFIRTLSEPYYGHMVGKHFKDFADMIVVGDRIDIDVKEGKLTLPYAKTAPQRDQDFRKEADVNYIHPARPSTSQQPSSYMIRGRHHSQVNNNRSRPEPAQTKQGQMEGPRVSRVTDSERSWPKFNNTNADLYCDLLEAHLIGPRPYNPVQPPFPAWYNPNAKCEYHMGAVGHSIEHCAAFKRNVLDLLDAKHISIQTEDNQDMAANPLPGHD